MRVSKRTVYDVTFAAREINDALDHLTLVDDALQAYIAVSDEAPDLAESSVRSRLRDAQDKLSGPAQQSLGQLRSFFKLIKHTRSAE